jgi:hypothetical protein
MRNAERGNGKTEFEGGEAKSKIFINVIFDIESFILIPQSEFRIRLNPPRRGKLDRKLRSLANFGLNVDSRVVGFDDFFGRR